MNSQQKSTSKQSQSQNIPGNKSQEQYSLFDCPDFGGGDKPGPHPRCLSTLPDNIDELVNHFKSQSDSV